ncbi:hypothetical protein H0H93_016625 [Arthromyces matolae]|nr:hypothetical protein H0H93_016625 [Arthromyces matolae]
MGLLHWCTLEPLGNSDPLAAVRFAAPVRISSIRIFPSGAKPFLNAPAIVAETEPEAFYLDVFLNAHPIPQADVKDKPRVPNALVPTSIAYAGRQVEYALDLGPEYATRLMVIKGKFTKLSIAIYGDIVLDAPSPTEIYEPKALPVIEPVSLSKAIDPSTSSDPSHVARKILALMPDMPPLPLVVRLMFCLKPPNDDWDLPEFPYLHPNLNLLSDDGFDLEAIHDLLSRPVRDDTTEEELSTFAAKVVNCIPSPMSANDTYSIAKLFSISASQHPGLARTLLDHLDLNSLFTSQTLDEETLHCLIEASSNADIARRMNTESFLQTLSQVAGSCNVDALTQQAAQRLTARIANWQCFEDALTNVHGNFNQAWKMLLEIGTEESSMAIWLATMITHEDFVSKVADFPVRTPLPSHCYLDSRNTVNITSHDTFITLVRAFIGVASLLAVWAWTDSVGNDACREQIVNHLLLLRQLTRRLTWISSDNEIPRQSGILAEKIICELAKDPSNVLNIDLAETILSLKSPLTFITETELASLRKIALVSEDGLPAAVEELLYSGDRPLSLRRLRTLRVSLAIINRELDQPKGEWKTLEAFWDDDSPGIVACLIDTLVVVSEDLNKHFILFPPPLINQVLTEQLFLISDELLHLVNQLAPVFPPTAWTMRKLVVASADIFECASTAEKSRLSLSAHSTSQSCLELLQTLSSPSFTAEPNKVGAEVVLKTLLQHAKYCNDRDPVLHLLHIFTLVDQVLPNPFVMLYDEGQPSHWVTNVFPNVLEDLTAFMRLLDPKKKTLIVDRLAELDKGVLGIGAWLITQELKDMTRTIETLAGRSRHENYELILCYQVTLSLQFLLGLIEPSSHPSKWCLHAIESDLDLSVALKSAIMALHDGQYASSHLDTLIAILADSAKTFDEELQFSISLAALRISSKAKAPQTHTLIGAAARILVRLSPAVISPEPLRLEVGAALSALATHEELDADIARDAFSLLQWLSTQEPGFKYTVICGLSPDFYSALFSILHISLPAETHDTLATLEAIFTLDENDHLPPPTVMLPEVLKLSIHDLDDLMRQEIPTPTTPQNGAKTPDILGVVISPPTAILRSQAVTTGLTKTYTNNDFRELRQTPSARQNTSRLPSMHVFPGSELEIFPSVVPMLTM